MAVLLRLRLPTFRKNSSRRELSGAWGHGGGLALASDSQVDVRPKSLMGAQKKRGALNGDRQFLPLRGCGHHLTSDPGKGNGSAQLRRS